MEKNKKIERKWMAHYIDAAEPGALEGSSGRIDKGGAHGRGPAGCIH